MNLLTGLESEVPLLHRNPEPEMVLPIKGFVELYAVDKKLHKSKLVYTAENLITSATKQRLASAMAEDYDISSRPYATHCEIGIGTTSPANDDNGLAVPIFRTHVDSTSSDVNRIFYIFFLSSGNSNFHITEVGLFGTASADDTIGSGVLLARTLVDFDNSGGNFELILTWRLTIG